MKYELCLCVGWLGIDITGNIYIFLSHTLLLESSEISGTRTRWSPFLPKLPSDAQMFALLRPKHIEKNAISPTSGVSHQLGRRINDQTYPWIWEKLFPLHPLPTSSQKQPEERLMVFCLSKNVITSGYDCVLSFLKPTTSSGMESSLRVCKPARLSLEL